MAYQFYIDGLQLPITPSKLQLKIQGNNKTVSLLNQGEVNVLKLPGLTEVSFDAVIPQVKYPFAMGNEKATVYLNKLEELKIEKKAFQFIVIRIDPARNPLFNTNMKVSLEDYTIEEDAEEGLDLTVSIKLKQYRDYGTRLVKVISTTGSVSTGGVGSENSSSSGTNIVTVEDKRNDDSAPNVKTYTVVRGDCLWNIAKRYLGNGARYTEIYNLNKDKIQSPNLIYPGQVLILPT